MGIKQVFSASAAFSGSQKQFKNNSESRTSTADVFYLHPKSRFGQLLSLED